MATPSAPPPKDATPATRPRRTDAPPRGGIRQPAAVAAARITSGLTRLARHRGTALPGFVAERVWPATFASLASQLRSSALVVGTNGKTTTADLIAAILRGAHGRPIANRSGSNMRQGIVTTLVRASDLRGRLRLAGGEARDAVFEVDELALEQILPELGRTVIVATNLFRDQLDRYGEADSIVDRWAAALPTAADGSLLVYCADDPRLAMLAAESTLPTLTFGLAGPPSGRDSGPESAGMAADPVACRVCGRQLEYEWRSVGHLGAFACPEGHIRRLAPDVTVEVLTPATRADEPSATIPRASLRISDGVETVIARPSLPGLTNAYNVAAALTAARALGHDLASSAAAIDGSVAPFGRFEWMEIEGRRLILVLVKNTISLAETSHLIPLVQPDLVLLALNDAPADGRDVSWIWDAPIVELVAGRTVVLCGSRADDLQLRLKYDAAVVARPPRSVEAAGSLAAGLDRAVAGTRPGQTILAGATYTAMMGLRTIAQRRGVAPPPPH